MNICVEIRRHWQRTDILQSLLLLPGKWNYGFLYLRCFVFAVILAGVKNGVERVSRVMMPMMIVLAVVVAVYSVTRPGAVEGIKYFLIPNLEHFSIMTVVAAMGQMFYSLSIAMGILYTYGSYIGKEVDVEKSTTQVEVLIQVWHFLQDL